jgi:hypothetical protein
MKKIDSRNLQINTEKCVEAVGGYRYDLVLIASERLRELKRQNKGGTRYYTAIDALLDVQEGRIDPIEYLAKVDTKKQIISR